MECLDCGNPVAVAPRPPAKTRCIGCSNFHHLKRKYFALVDLGERYIKAHSGVRVRCQEAELAQEYEEAGKAFEDRIESIQRTRKAAKEPTP